MLVLAEALVEAADVLAKLTEHEVVLRLAVFHPRHQLVLPLQLLKFVLECRAAPAAELRDRDL